MAKLSKAHIELLMLPQIKDIGMFMGKYLKGSLILHVPVLWKTIPKLFLTLCRLMGQILFQMRKIPRKMILHLYTQRE